MCVCVRACVCADYVCLSGGGRDGQKRVHGSPVCELKYPVYRCECARVHGSHCECVDVFALCMCAGMHMPDISMGQCVCVCVCVCVLGGTEGLHESVPCVCARGGWDGRRQPTRHAGRGKPSRWRGLNDSFLPSSPLRLVQPPSSDLGPGYFANPTALEGSQPSLFLRDESRWQEQEGCPPPSTNSKMPTCLYKPYANEPCSQPLSTTCLMGIIDGASSGA